MSVPSVREDYVFLNLPYDTAFERLYIAYIVGISAFRLFPHTTLEIPDSTRRLDRIQALLHECRYSIHRSIKSSTVSHCAANPALQYAFRTRSSSQLEQHEPRPAFLVRLRFGSASHSKVDERPCGNGYQHSRRDRPRCYARAVQHVCPAFR